MTRADRDMWTKALRSGEYTQGHGALRRLLLVNSVIAYCCLGVLTEILRTAVGGVWKEYSSLSRVEHTFICANSHQSSLFLPDSIREKVKLNSQIEAVLAAMNDGENYNPADHGDYKFESGKRHTFAEIADWIEQNVPVTD